MSARRCCRRAPRPRAAPKARLGRPKLAWGRAAACPPLSRTPLRCPCPCAVIRPVRLHLEIF